MIADEGQHEMNFIGQNQGNNNMTTAEAKLCIDDSVAQTTT